MHVHGRGAHLQALHDMVGDAAAAHCAHSLPLDVIGLPCHCRHVPLVVDDLAQQHCIQRVQTQPYRS